MGGEIRGDAPSLRESPRQQAYQPGDEFYEAWVDTDEGSVDMAHWVVSAVRGDKVFAIRKTDYTWVKRSSKTGDYGWAASIDDYCRRSFRLDDGPPKDWARSKAAAYTKALPSVEEAIKRLSKIRAQMLGQRSKQRSKKSASLKGARKDGASQKETSQ